MTHRLTDDELRAIRKRLVAARRRVAAKAIDFDVTPLPALMRADDVAALLAEVERLSKGVAVAREAAEQPTDHDEDTEAEIALGHRILAAVGETGPRTFDGPTENGETE